MVDTHFHLDHCEAPVRARGHAARARPGVERMLAIGMTGDSCRHALAAADEHDEVFVSVGRHPHESEGFDDAGARRAARAARAHPKARAIGEAGPRLQARLRAARRPARARSSPRSSWRATLGRPLVVHTREAADDTLDAARRATATACAVIIHCFSLTDRVRGVRRARLLLLVRRATSPIRRRPTCSGPPRAVPDELLLAETDAPFLSPQERRGKPNEPAYVTATAALPRRAARHLATRRWSGSSTRNAARLFGW